MFRNDAEYPIADAHEFPEGTHRVVRIGNREIGVFNIAGEYHALPNLCPHQRGPLCAGRLSGTLTQGPRSGLMWVQEGEVIACPWHSLEFNVRSGQCIAWPEIRLRKFETRVAGGKVYVRA